MESAQPFNLLTANITPDNCEREPVHIPGCINPHGTLVACTWEDGRILQCANNSLAFLAHAPEALLGKRLDELFGEGLLERLQNSVVRATSPIWMGRWLESDYDLLAHRSQDTLLLEWEPRDGEEAHKHLLTGVQSALSRLQSCSAIAELSSLLTLEVKNLLGIDRVMVYRFLPDWSGDVVAEAASPELTASYLGLRFPSTDIPGPARAVYEKVWIRLIQEAAAQPVGIVPLVSPDTGQPLDLTYSVLRAVSSMHVEYLANIGVVGTVSCSIRVHGKLWGLLACHHYRPLILHHSARAALELIAQMASQRIGHLLSVESQQERGALHRVLDELSERFDRNEEVTLGLALPSLPRVVESCGVAIPQQQGWLSLGDVPSEGELQEIHRMCKLRLQSGEGLGGGRIYYSDRLPALRNSQNTFFCGLLAVAPAGLEGEFALWFRRGESFDVRWGGDPGSKEIRYGPSGARLHPRSSFAEYIEHSSVRSKPWSDLDLWKTEQFLRTLDSASARQARRVMTVNQMLQDRNEELDAFAYIASHDLKEPLRGIHTYAHFLNEDFGETLPEAGKSMLTGLLGLTARMESLITSLLTYSRLGHQELNRTEVNLEEVILETITLLKASQNLIEEVTIAPALPRVVGHRPFLEEIIANLLSNAVKYSDAGRRLEVGWQEDSAHPGYVTFHVRDNGIGIAPEFQERVFLLFRRLHMAQERGGGSGAGLTIVRRMVGRHGGQVWLESALGEGTTVYFTLPKAGP